MDETIEISSTEEEVVQKSAVKKEKKKLITLRKDRKQATLKNYFSKTSSVSYFKIYQKSSLPVQKNADLSMTQMLEVQLHEEDRILTDSQIEPNKDVKLECITANFQNNVDTNRLFEEIVSKIYAPQDYVKQNINMEKSLVAVESEESDENEPENDENKKRAKKKKAICPTYKIVEGSLFAVDAFRYGDIRNVEHYFLTHFHSDHYIGLKKKFCHKLYLSEITAKLVRQFIGVSEEYLNVVYVDVPFYVDDVCIIPLDANHCPGALLFLFKFPDGRSVLHTGDFRANDEMIEKLHQFECPNLDLIYLDTTYLHSKRRMPSQNESIQFVLDNVEKYLENNIGEKFLILVGAYLIGKEKVWMSIAEKFNFKVYLEKERLKAFKEICTASIEFFRFFKTHVTLNEAEAEVRIVNMMQITYTSLRDFLSENQDMYNTILGIAASGWENNKYSSGRISSIHCQYSEHSSYDELEKFIVRTNPKNVISTVPIRPVNSNVTADIPKEWLTSEGRNKKKKQQQKLSVKKS